MTPTRDDVTHEAPAHRGLFDFFVDRPVLTLMVTATVVLVGILSLIRLPLRFIPDGLTNNQVRIWVPVQEHRTPTEVEDKIVEPLEELLRTIPGLKEITSESSSTNAMLTITLDEGMDIALVSAEVRDRAQRARAQWPEDVDRYFTWREDGSSMPLAFLQLLVPEQSPEWDYLIDKVVQPRIEAVDGVGRMDVWGLLDQTVRLWFNRDKLIAHHVDFRRLLERLAGDNIAEPIGEIDDGQHHFLVRVDARFESANELNGYPVKPGLRLSDIARIERVPSVRNRLSRYNQKYTYTSTVVATAGSNPVDASRRLRATLSELQRDPRLAKLQFRFLIDAGELIEDSLDTLLSTALQGGILALVVLFLFLRNLRFTIAIALAIPLALLIVGAWMFFANSSLNLLTMAGMTLAVGMVVDNSVVVLENIRRLRELGMGLREACVNGAREVGLAVTMATLTTVVVILPMVFMSNSQTRIMLGAIGITLSVALVGSLCVALLLLPAGVRNLGSTVLAKRDHRSARRLAWLSPVQLLMRLNQLLLRFSLKHRLLAIGLTTLAVTTCRYPAERLEFKSGELEVFGGGDVAINLKMPRGLDLPEVEAEVIRYEDFILEHRDDWHVDSVSSRFSRRDATINITLDKTIGKSDIDSYRQRIEAAWPRRPGTDMRLSEASDSPGSSNNSSERDQHAFVVRLYGRDTRYLMGLADAIRADLLQRPEVSKLEIPQVSDNREVTVRFRRDRLQDLGVQPEVLFGSVVTGLQGQLLTELDEDGRDIRVIAEFDNEHNPSLLDLKDTQVFSSRGNFQRLSSLADIQFEEAVSSIRRQDGRTNVTLVGRRAAGVGAGEMGRVLSSVMKRHPLPRGYSWTDESQFREEQVEMGELLDALYLGITLVFLLMGVLFESIILPGAILFTVPFAICGAYWSLFFFLGTIDPMAIVGMILLAGIVVNNGIVLLDCIARLRQHMSRDEAILEGTRQRLRPILMTAMTTIAGLLPMAIFGDPDEGVSYVSMAVAVAGGLTISTVVTAFVVPLTYTFMDDFSVWLRRVWSRAAGRAAPPSLVQVSD